MGLPPRRSASETTPGRPSVGNDPTELRSLDHRHRPARRCLRRGRARPGPRWWWPSDRDRTVAGSEARARCCARIASLHRADHAVLRRPPRWRRRSRSARRCPSTRARIRPSSFSARDVLPARIAGRKVLAQIAERHRAQQRVADRVREHVGVAVACRAPSRRRSARRPAPAGGPPPARGCRIRSRRAAPCQVLAEVRVSHASASSRSWRRGDLEVERLARREMHPVSERFDQRRVVGRTHCAPAAGMRGRDPRRGGTPAASGRTRVPGAAPWSRSRLERPRLSVSGERERGDRRRRARRHRATTRAMSSGSTSARAQSWIATSVAVARQRAEPARHRILPLAAALPTQATILRGASARGGERLLQAARTGPDHDRCCAIAALRSSASRLQVKSGRPASGTSALSTPGAESARPCRRRAGCAVMQLERPSLRAAWRSTSRARGSALGDLKRRRRLHVSPSRVS